MTAGLFVKNATGSTIIDELRPNYSLRYHDSASVVTAPSPYSSQGYLRLSFVAEAPLVAICSSRFTAFAQASRNGSSWTYELFVEGLGGTIEYFIFDKAKNIPTSDSGFGMQVFNASTEKVFDACYPPALVTAVLAQPVTITTAEVVAAASTTAAFVKQTLNYTAGRRYAVVHSTPITVIQAHHAVQAQSLAALVSLRTAARGGSDSVAVGYLPTNSGMTTCNYSYSPNIFETSVQSHTANYNGTVLDVTNF